MMKKTLRLLSTGLLLANAGTAMADVHYVDVNSTNATPPYTNWSVAATIIQDAVDAAVAGDEVVVTNGTYANGGRSINGVTTNRMAVDKPLNVKSVNGPQFTTINGGGGVRCAYLTNEASLSGFSLRNGNPNEVGGGARDGTLNNCTLTGNSAFGGGGGAILCTLNNCTLTGNSASSPNNVQGPVPAYGGGAYDCTLNNCTLSRNIIRGMGGGAYGCALNNCTLTSNSASFFDGIGPADHGGGAFGGTLNNCKLIGNHSLFGGGAWGGRLINCTLTGNSAGYGGGAADCHIYNCIVYFNSAPYGADCYSDKVLGFALLFSCTTPPQYDRFYLSGTIYTPPLFMDQVVGNLRLQPNSPCINAGDNSYVTNATDLDGNPRISGGIVDIGAYEFQLPQLTIAPSGPNVLLTWPTNNVGYDYTGFILQFATNLVAPVVWSTNSPAPIVIGGLNTVTNPISGAQQFYRLGH